MMDCCTLERCRTLLAPRRAGRGGFGAVGVRWVGRSSRAVRSAAGLFQRVVLGAVRCPRRQKEYLVMMDCCTLERCQTLLAPRRAGRGGFGAVRVKWVGRSSRAVRSAAGLFQRVVLGAVRCPRRQKKSLVMMDCCTLEGCRALLAPRKAGRGGFGAVRVRWVGRSSRAVRSAAGAFQRAVLGTLRDGVII
eukprot:UN0128